MPAQLQRRLLIFAVLLTLVVGSLFAHWLLIGRFIESTDNAYVQAPLVQVTAQVAGTVVAVLADDTDAAGRFRTVYGTEPTSIHVFLPFATAAENFEAWQEHWTAGALQHHWHILG